MIKQKIYPKFDMLLLAFLLLSFGATAQTINTTIGTTGYVGTNNSGTNGWITFVIENSSGAPINLTSIGNWTNNSHNGTTSTLWYSSTSLSGPVSSLSSPTWTSISSATVSGISSSTLAVNTVISGMSFTIPNGAQYRFALHTTGTNYYSGGTSSPSPNSITTSGITIRNGDYQISGQNVGYGATNTPRYFTGEVVFTPAGPACTAPTGLASTSLTSTSATISWSPIAGSIGYDFLRSTSPTPPASGFSTTTTASVSNTGLTPSTTYYFHVRNKCSATSSSTWVTYSFTTYPPCRERRITVKNITTDTANVSWDTAMHALGYEYAITASNTMPPGSIISTTKSSVNAKGLMEGTKYYVFVRMKCPGGETSGWVVDSFRTRIVCRPPKLNTEYLNQERTVVYWDPMPSAIAYQYEVSQSPTPLGKGTKILNNSFLAYPLKDNSVYYFHVKSECSDQGFDSESDWISTSFKTWPTAIPDLPGNLSLISVYPNPIKDQMTVKISAPAANNAQITISDLSGKIVDNINVNYQSMTINTGKLPAGVYMLKYSDMKNSGILKIIKD